MINPNVEQLESLISAVVNNLYKEVPPTEDEFLEKATLLRNTNAPIMMVSDDEFAEIISRLKQSLGILFLLMFQLRRQRNRMNIIVWKIIFITLFFPIVLL